MPGPLSSLKILDFSTLLPGPFASMFLADLGADVVRVEALNRQDMVRSTPPFEGKVSAVHALLNRSKRSLALDLKMPEAVDIIKRLIQIYDIVLEQFRPGVMDRLGLGYEILKTANPKLIYCALTGYGQSGPYRDRAGHDINYLALSGVASHTGRRQHGPLPLGVQVADVGGGSYNAMVGILAAVIHRRQTGEGQLVDISMYDGTLAWNAMAVAHYFATGDDPGREQMLLNGGTFYDYYRTNDGGYLSVGSLEPKFWNGFCKAIERPDLIQQGLSLDAEAHDQVKVEIQKTIASRSLDEWMEIFARVDVCVEPVLNVSEVVQHPQTLAREMVVNVPRKDGATQKQVANPIKFSKCQANYRHIGSSLGEHTEEILMEVGYSKRKIKWLWETGVTV